MSASHRPQGTTVRSVTLRLPWLFRGVDNLELKAAVDEGGRSLQWSRDGSHSSLDIQIKEGQRIQFGMFSRDARLTGGTVEMKKGKIRFADREILPIIGYRPWIDIQIIPSLFGWKEKK